jgi:hypothetical protein
VGFQGNILRRVQTNASFLERQAILGKIRISKQIIIRSILGTINYENYTMVTFDVSPIDHDNDAEVSIRTH